MAGCAAILCGSSAWADATALDDALESGDVGRLLEILGPGELEVDTGEGDAQAGQTAGAVEPEIRRALEQGDMRAILERVIPPEPEPATGLEVEHATPAEAVPGAIPPSGAAKRHRSLPFLGGAGGEEKRTEPAPAITITAVEQPKPDLSPRRAHGADAPVEVPLTRPRRTGMSLAAAAEKAGPPPGLLHGRAPGTVTVINIPPVPDDATEPADAGVADTREADEASEVESVALEDRSRASAELVALLNIRRAAAAPAVKSEEPAATPRRELPQAADEPGFGPETGADPLGAAALPSPQPAAGVLLEGNPDDPRVSAVRTFIMGPAGHSPGMGSVNDPILPIRKTIDQLFEEARMTTEPGVAVAVEATGSYGGWRYDGSWINGRMDGHGVLAYPDGWTYDGEWRGGRMTGQGTLRHPDGWQYEGEWRDATMDGEGTLVFPDGWKYIGEWRGGRMHGTGRLLHPANDQISRR